MLATGVLRLTLGAKGAAFYMGQPMVPRQDRAVRADRALFHPAPTLAFPALEEAVGLATGLHPRRRRDPRARRWVLIESHLFIFLPLFAVLMARGMGI